jgi:GTPase SAR1 family protein
MFYLQQHLTRYLCSFNITFETPELAIVGMQSDGKSSFIEALLGFQFNIVESNIGTRRPLILQMINNPDKQRPSCRFRKDYVARDNEDPFEPVETPVECLTDEISSRTNAVAGMGDQVSSSPIILRVEYCYCANLTIWDMPGFRMGGDDELKYKIQRMAEDVMKQKNRIILCVEQSTVEWSNSLSRPLVRSIDPTFSRTVLVNTK